MSTQHEDKIDARHEFELWMSNKGEAVNHAGDGMYQSPRVNRQAEAFRAGLDVALARKAQESETVPVPTSVDMARLMLGMSYAWLKEHAPEHVPAQEPAIPAGYALVPLELSDTMLHTWDSISNEMSIREKEEIYVAILAAAGVAPQEPAVKAGAE